MKGYDGHSAAAAQIVSICVSPLLFSLLFTPPLPVLHDQSVCTERDSYKVWKISTGVCPRLEFDDITLINHLGYDVYICGAFEFLCNSLSIYDVTYDITPHLKVPVINISTVSGIPCNGRWNV